MNRASADEIATYLERHGLTDLLALHLERQLEQAESGDAAAILDRLASLYSQLLETTTDAVAHDRLRTRAMKLLAAAPGATPVDELRLALLRGSYRQTEKIAEDHRLRLAQPNDLERARTLLQETTPELVQLRARLRDSLEQKSRRLNRAAGADAMQLSAETDELRGRLSQTMFLLAWSQYYRAFLEQKQDDAQAAQVIFAELLELDRARPQPKDVSVDLRGVESIARSILGMALAKSVTASTGMALEWLRLLEEPRTFEPLREEVPAWRLAIFLEAGEFARAMDEWEACRRRRSPMPLAWVRLAAVHALESAAKDGHAARLAQEAMAELAGRGELEQIVQLARIHGTQAMGDSGFAQRYVRGVILFHEARAAHGSDEPTTDPELREAYASAAAELEAAIRQPDADTFAAPGGARLLLGWCLYLQSQWSSAGESFESAAQSLPPEQAAEALWMAVLSLDHLEREQPGPATRRRLDALIDAVLTHHPSSPRAPLLLLKRAMAQTTPTAERVEQLLAIPTESSAYDGAQRRAAQMLDALRTAAAGDARASYSHRFVEVSMALLRRDLQDLRSGAMTAPDGFINRLRRVLDVTLSEAPMRPEAAAATLDLMEAAADVVDWSGHEAELSFRRLQERLAAWDMAAARALADRLWSAHAQSPWAGAAQRLVFKAVVQRPESMSSLGSDERAALAAAAAVGRRVVQEIDARSDPSLPSEDQAWLHAQADVLRRLWERFNDAAAGRESLALYRRLLEWRGRDPGVLRAAGVLEEGLGDPARALEHWRLLVAGVREGSEEWFEAKFHLLSILAQVDAVRARAAMDQHKHLNPDYGPEPWRSRLQALDQRISGGSGAMQGTGS